MLKRTRAWAWVILYIIILIITISTIQTQQGCIDDLEFKDYANGQYIQHIEGKLSECEAELDRLQVFYSDIACP